MFPGMNRFNASGHQQQSPSPNNPLAANHAPQFGAPTTVFGYTPGGLQSGPTNAPTFGASPLGINTPYAPAYTPTSTVRHTSSVFAQSSQSSNHPNMFGTPATPSFFNRSPALSYSGVALSQSVGNQSYTSQNIFSTAAPRQPIQSVNNPAPAQPHTVFGQPAASNVAPSAQTSTFGPYTQPPAVQPSSHTPFSHNPVADQLNQPHISFAPPVTPTRIGLAPTVFGLPAVQNTPPVTPLTALAPGASVSTSLFGDAKRIISSVACKIAAPLYGTAPPTAPAITGSTMGATMPPPGYYTGHSVAPPVLLASTAFPPIAVPLVASPAPAQAPPTTTADDLAKEYANISLIVRNERLQSEALYGSTKPPAG